MYLKQRFWDAVHAAVGFFKTAAYSVKDWERHAARQTMLRLDVPTLKVPDHTKLCQSAAQIVGTPYWQDIKIQLLSETEIYRSRIAFQMNPEADGFREKFIEAQMGIRSREDIILRMENWAQEAQEIQEDLENGEDR